MGKREGEMMVKISNAFIQNRRAGLSSNDTVKQTFEKAKKKHINYKHLAAISQAVANISKKRPKVARYFGKVAKIARYLGHLRDKGAYSLKYPSEKPYERDAKQARLAEA
jgi:hypothetical protein